MGQFALEIAAYSLDFFEKFFDQKFPLPIPVLSWQETNTARRTVVYDMHIAPVNTWISFLSNGLCSLPNA
jgi:aminopeptidase N